MGRFNPTGTGQRLVKVIFTASMFQRISLTEWKRRRAQIKLEGKYKRLLIRPSLPPEQLAKEKEEREKKRAEYLQKILQLEKTCKWSSWTQVFQNLL